MAEKRKRREDFLTKYRATDAYIQSPDKKNGGPGLIAGQAQFGDPVLIKVWVRNAGTAGDDDLREIWLHELRQLHRLAAYPGARDCIVSLVDAGYDDKHFYLVLSPGQRRPLAKVLANAGANHWLNSPRRVAARLRIWENLKRLARGLETLHLQGLLHRNLSEWSVLTAGTDEDDFQLTGFEWSMRVASLQDTVGIPGPDAAANMDGESFDGDWKKYGLLAAKLLGIDLVRLYDQSIVPHMVADHLSASEAALIRDLVMSQPLLRLDGDAVIEDISAIQRTLRAQVASRDPKLVIAVRLGPDSDLSRAVRRASNQEIEINDIAEQLLFIKNDLSDTPQLYMWEPYEGGPQRLTIRGRQLRYQLSQYSPLAQDAQPTWDIARCERVDFNGPPRFQMEAEFPIPPEMLEVITVPEANTRFHLLRGKVTSWNDYRELLLDENAEASDEEQTYKALMLLQLLEILHAAATVFPVEIDSYSGSNNDPDSGETRVRLRVREDKRREDLSKALHIDTPARRLEQALLGDGVKPSGWKLTDSGALGDRSPAETDWEFKDEETGAGGGSKVFIFTGPMQPAVARELFLVPNDAAGSGVQFRRRLKALAALREHQELLGMIADPRERILESHETVAEDAAFQDLDEAKQRALKELTAIVPFYMVQGPPGVGKTRLVRDLVKRRLAEEPTSRLLLTAQSNAAINHLLDELHEVLKAQTNSDLLVVRSKSKDDDGTAGAYDIQEQSKKLLGQLAASNLAKSIPATLKRKLDELTAAATASADDEDGGDQASTHGNADRVYHAFEGVVARAANVVFATTNSYELERLIEERGQFDWAMVEEAAKATGTEIIAPLLLSHRRLMIGDHRQLPPFAAQQMAEILATDGDVKAALDIGQPFIGRGMRAGAGDEFFEEIRRRGKDLPALCAAAHGMLYFFETAITREFTRQGKGAPGRAIASTLTSQHRMHPEIAALVSRCFYKGDLTTPEGVKDRFSAGTPPFKSIDAKRLPVSPVVVVEMPYIQAVKGATGRDELPRWHNTQERFAVLDALSQIRAVPKDGKKPTLAILSPYARQVDRLKELIHKHKGERLAHLADFAYPTSEETFCHTVDSFQGSEADLVIVSLVRNNQHSNARTALGFLTNPQRMNVLLSRAKWQLVLVCSLGFLEEVTRAIKAGGTSDEVSFLSDLLAQLRSGISSGNIVCVPASALAGEKP